MKGRSGLVQVTILTALTATFLLAQLINVAPPSPINSSVDGAPWNRKSIPAWTKEDAIALLSDSPWAKATTVEIEKSSSAGTRMPGGRRGAMGGGRMGGIGIGMGGIGIGGMGRGPGMDRRPAGDSDVRHEAPGPLTLRWESALPLQEAHLKLGDQSAAIDEDHYRIAIVNIPRRLFREDPGSLEKRLQSKGELKREGRKTIHSSSARVLDQENGMTIFFDFDRKYEIVPGDESVEFLLQLDNVKIDQQYTLSDMLFHGKLAL